MKRIIALTLAVLMIAALFCACGEKKKSDSSAASEGSGSVTATENATPKTVTTTVEAKYDKGFAENYAKSVSTDEDGNKVYEFDGNSYNDYTRDYNNNVSSQITNILVKAHDSSYGQYAYLNNEKKAAIIGLNPGQYDEEVAAEEAKEIAQNAFLYFQGLSEPVDTISVIYCNASNQDEIYGSFEFSAE